MASNPADYQEATVIRERKIDDRTYELYTRVCKDCNTPQFEVWRWCGSSVSRYYPTGGFDVEDFDAFAEMVDETLLMRACDLVAEFKADLMKVNSPAGIVADGSFEFRLLEYGRHRASTLQRLGMLQIITTDAEPCDDVQSAVRAAFELGMAASEQRLMHLFEDYIHKGIEVEEWREAGLPRAREERLRRGAKTRKAVIAAAKEVYARDRSLARNDLATAREILRLNVPQLQKGMGRQLGEDAITKHLRIARKGGEL